jgi:uncharacterized protein (TIGR03067 family)
MRNSILLFAMICIIGCASSKNSTGNAHPLNGNWVAVFQEFGGNPLPAAAYDNQKLIISDSNFTVIAESVDKGTVKVSSNQIDIFGKEGVNKGKHFTAIFKLENNELTICYNLKGTEYPAEFNTKGKPLYFLSRFKKEQSDTKK